MKNIKRFPCILGTLLLGTVATATYAEECNFTWVLINEDGSKTRPAQYAEKDRREAECKQRLADEKQQAGNARKRLDSEFGVDPSDMTDGEAIARLQEEVNKRDRASKEELQRRQEAAESKRMSQIEQTMDKQDQMLKGLGVNLGTLGTAGGSDNDVDGAELQMYEQMVNRGVAPQCKGKKGEALIDCVDAVVDAEDKKN